MREYPDRPLVGVGVVLFRGEDIVLIRRGRSPALGQWSFPGGAQRLGETAEVAARRELREETGLEAGTLRLAAHADSITYDEAGRIQYHYTILDFVADYVSGTLRSGGDALEARFVSLSELPQLALTPMVIDVIEAARRLR